MVLCWNFPHGYSGHGVTICAEKLLGLRIFPDDAGKMNLNIVDAGGALLVISQFTLYGDCRKGRSPSFDDAAPPGPTQGSSMIIS